MTQQGEIRNITHNPEEDSYDFSFYSGTNWRAGRVTKSALAELNPGEPVLDANFHANQRLISDSALRRAASFADGERVKLMAGGDLCWQRLTI
jgi:hypothetical protein